VEAAVDLKNDAAVAVSVPLGTDNGVTRDSDFQVAADNGTVLIYPLEIFDNRFWSQPLSDEAYARIRTGMEVRPAALDKAAHAKVRAEGKARKTEIRARQEEARREEETKKIEELKDNRERLSDKRDALEDRIAAAERDLADEEGRMSWLFDSEDSSIERSLQNIQDMADKRDELQSQRDALPRSSSRGDGARISAEIKRLNDRISSERDGIRIAQDRKRQARSAYLARKQEWKKLVAERNALQNEIRSIDQKIQALSGKR
jgi:predicted  nucleic acid-binding Zn-ribbon protein